MNARGSAGQYKQFRRKAKLVREDAEVVHAQYMCALKASWQNTCRLQLRPVVVKALVASHEPWMQKWQTESVESKLVGSKKLDYRMKSFLFGFSSGLESNVAGHMGTWRYVPWNHCSGKGMVARPCPEHEQNRALGNLGMEAVSGRGRLEAGCDSNLAEGWRTFEKRAFWKQVSSFFGPNSGIATRTASWTSKIGKGRRQISKVRQAPKAGTRWSLSGTVLAFGLGACRGWRSALTS